MSGDLMINYPAAHGIARAFTAAQEDLEASATTMPTSVNAGKGTDYIITALVHFSEISGVLGQAAARGATSTEAGVSRLQEADEDTASGAKGGFQ